MFLFFGVQLDGLFDESTGPSAPANGSDPASELPSIEQGRWPELNWVGKVERTASLCHRSCQQLNFGSPQVGNTCLHVAARNGDSAMAVCLLKAGAAANAVNDAGCSALHDAAARGFTWVVMCLLRGGTDPNIQDLGGCTALHLASYRGQVEAMNALLSQDADQDMVNRRGETALHCAAHSGCAEAAQVLIFLCLLLVFE